MKRTQIFCAALALTTLSSFANAENHALLIGASTYPNLEERYWLKGPANDVDLVSTYLANNPAVPFADQNITILADGVEGSIPPTLAAIRTAFAAIAAKVGKGDFVYLHFSGHGSQAPAGEDSDETDGLDELFLPVDIGPWQDEIGTVTNALVDDEIGALIDSIRDTGANVWVVFDSCHSGTATRAAPSSEDIRLRKLDSGALGIPDSAMAAAQTTTRALPAGTDRAEAPILAETDSEKGLLTAFFAAQTDETTPEKNMPKGKEGRRLQGVFTYTLFETLAERPNLTYRQLGQEILRKYSVKNLARSTPMFEGDLDQRVFDQGADTRVLQWIATPTKSGAKINAGVLHGLTPGAELLLVKSPADTDEDAIAVFRVTSADTFKATAKPVGEAVEIPKGAMLRKSTTVVDFSLTVALPSAQSAAFASLEMALQEISKLNLLSKRIQFVPEGDPNADLRLSTSPDAPHPDAIYFLPASGLLESDGWEKIPSITTKGKTTPELADALADNLSRIAKATNLLKIGASAPSSSLSVTVDMTKSKFDPETEEVVENSRSLSDAVKVPRMAPNDVIGLRLSNENTFPIDYNILYIGSDYSVSFMDNGRLLPGSKLEDDFILVTDEAFGKDRLLVILSAAQDQTDVQDLSFLEQSPLQRTRSTGQVGLAGLFDEAGFGETTRAAVSLSKRKKKSGPPPMVIQFEVETVPGD